ncbi:S-layer protein [filamentous cyanobacterium CCP5]|nr:S-layer protein [filamentous cyanobacterium CCP5]
MANRFLSVSTSLVISLMGASFWTGCAGTPLGDSVEQSLEADPQLEEQARSQAGSTPTDTTAETGAASERGTRQVRPPADQMGETATSTPQTNSTPAPTANAFSSSTLEQIPDELRPYLVDLKALGLLQTSGSEGNRQIQPNQPISRGQYAQWLLAANNRFYQDQPDKRIRRGVSSSAPVFEDVPSSHPAFGAVQGLAEAGIIPSPLTGNATTINFRPDAPLTRKDLVLWKVPLDTHAALPEATATAITEAWGFQDASKIEPLAQRAVLADHQNGEFANIRRAFGYTTLFQPDKAVTEAEAAAALWRFGSQTEGITATSLRQPSSQSTDRNGADRNNGASSE